MGMTAGMGTTVLMELKDRRELRVHRERQGHRGLKDRRDYRVFKDCRDRLDRVR
jgi:hypothetical protein